MFDKTVLIAPRQESTSSYSKVDIKEVKAPTDDSMRLLEEFRQKALDSVVDKFRIDNVFKAQVMVFKDWDKFETNTIAISLTVNGSNHRLKCEIGMPYDKMSALIAAYKAISDKVSELLLTQVQRDLLLLS